MAGLTLRGIIKRYVDAPSDTLKGIDLDILDGEFLVLVGPSGCGKSTLLRIIAGLESITTGTLSIGDREVNKLHPKDRDIAMVFQSYALYPHMSVRRNMSFGLEVRKTPKAEIDKLVDEAAKLLGLETQLDKLPKALSGGQRQRVAMGRAIVRRPKVFLFDEPLSNLDAALRTQMRVEMRRLHRALATTTVYVTHDQIEAMTLADRIAVLDQGILQQVGTPMTLFHTPANRFVAGFIGSPAMNFLEAKVLSKGGQFSLELDPKSSLVVASSVIERAGLEANDTVILGLRPQDLNLGVGTVHGLVDVVETLGWESHVHMKVAGENFLAAVETAQAHDLRPGSAIQLELPTAAVHLFDPKTGVALAHGREPSDDDGSKGADE